MISTIGLNLSYGGTVVEIRILYSQAQLDSVVEYISQNNENFLGKNKEVLQAIEDSIAILAADYDSMSLGTMGFLITADREFEGIDSDENICRIEIYVDPTICIKYELDESDIKDRIIFVPHKLETK